MVFDFATRPPEINSALMYSGPGAGPMMAAAATWNNLAAELSATAAAYESVISELSGEWMGPASSAMATAATPYVEWMNNTAAAAEHAATQASASAAAYQTAYAMTVPPPLIAANRAQLAALVATNILGQNTPAILATEAQYGEMWAQDAAAMYGYAGSSASAASLHQLTSPTATTNPAGAGAQSAAVSTASTQSQLSQLVSGMPSVLHALSSPAATTTTTTVNNGIVSGPDGFFNDLISSGGNIGWLNDAFDISGSFNGYDSAVFSSFASSGQSTSAIAAAASVMPQGLAGGLGTASVSATAPAATASLGSAPVLASAGQAPTVGRMSVPATWAAATPEPSAPTVTTADWNPDFDDGGGGTTNVATGMPAVASNGRAGHGFSTPRYGVKPTVMPTRVLV